MKKSVLKKFTIKGLFGVKDVAIPFEDTCKILVGENGIGKTQVLSILYYTLHCDFLSLTDFTFEYVELEVETETLRIQKTDIEELAKRFYIQLELMDFIDRYGFKAVDLLKNYVEDGKNKRKTRDLERFIEERSRYNEFSMHRVFRFFEMGEFDKQLEHSPLAEIKQRIAHNLAPYTLIYFPTYRRVEAEEAVFLGRESWEGEQLTAHIQFGMRDVQEKFDSIQSRIESLLKDGLSKFLNDVLRMVVDKTHPNDFAAANISQEDLEIIFARAKDLEPKLKEAVMRGIEEKEFNDPISGLLLQKLTELYGNQKVLDEAVKRFKHVCNAYLIEKEVVYDEPNIKLYVRSHITNAPIDLQLLSSGEKQLISIFSRVYLPDTDDKQCILLFDEPELSLSLKWQNKFLPDIIDSGKCDLLLAATHSPFIFENELDRFAIGINQYMTPSSNRKDNA